MSNQDITQRYIEVTADDLPLTCPMPNSPEGDRHPRVGLSFAHGKEVRCPYCSELYRFKGELPKGHH